MKKILLIVLLLSAQIFALNPNQADQAVLANMPVALEAIEAVYSPNDNHIYVWGGHVAGIASQAMYVLNLSNNTWANLGAAGSPASKYDYSAVYVADNDSIIYYSGYEPAPLGGLSSDVNEYDIATRAWQPLWLAQTVPVANHTSIYDATTQSIFSFGGQRSLLPVNNDSNRETYQYPVTTQVEVLFNPGNVIGLGLNRTNHGVAFDTANRIMYVFGGYFTVNSTFAIPAFINANDRLYVLNIGTNTWTNYSNNFAVTVRAEHAMHFDPLDNRIYLYGGIASPGAAANVQSNMISALVSNLAGFSVYDTNSAIVYVFQSYHGSAAYCSGMNGSVILGGYDNTVTPLQSTMGFARQPVHWSLGPLSNFFYPLGIDIAIELRGLSYKTGINLNTGTWEIRPGDSGEIVYVGQYPSGNLVFANNVATGTLVTDVSSGLDTGWYTLVSRTTDNMGFRESTTFTAFYLYIPIFPVPSAGPGPDLIIPTRTMLKSGKDFEIITNGTNATLYSYAELNVDKFGTDYEVPLIVTFSIDKSWFMGKDIDHTDIRLNWKNGELWTEMPTEFVEEKNGRYIYQTTISTYKKYFAVAARPGDCRDSGCGDLEKCALVGNSYFCIPEEQECGVTCPTGQVLDELTCKCIIPEKQIEEKAEVDWLTIGIGALAALFLIGLYWLLTKDRGRMHNV